MDAPLMGDDWSANERRLRFTEVATQILQCLAEHGSTVHHLYFASLQDVAGGEADEDGQTWPIYCFARGTVSVTGGRTRETVRTIAVPDPGYIKEG
jgi:hypothetical protein